jgi:hypothetical protein
VQSLKSLGVPLLILVITEEKLEIAEEEVKIWPVDKIAEKLKFQATL